MPFNGSGSFSPAISPGYPAVASTPILASQFNNVILDITNGLSNCVTRDGQSPASQNISIGGFKLVNVSPATLANDAVVLSQLNTTNANVTALTNSTNVSVARLDAAIGSNFRNKIIGGDFSLNPWQRGSSFVAAVNGQYTADRFMYSKSATAVHTITKALDAPTVVQAGVFSQHCLALAVTTAQTVLAAGDYVIAQQLVEGFNAASFGFGQAGVRNVTFSFWVKGAKLGIHCVAFTNSAQTRSYISEYTINAINTWEYKSITIPVDTTGSWLYDNLVGLIVRFALASGTTFNTTANAWQAGNFLTTVSQVNELDTIGNNFKIALPQLEFGSTATSFEVRSFAQELFLCQRYYELMPANLQYTAYTSASTDFGYTYAYKVTKRAIPAVAGTPAYSNASTLQTLNIDVNGFYIKATATALGAVVFTYNNGTMSAEL